jgi:hypothetical protein|tara:strand:+ start:275 stop:421 length:147 start_codon:yes stop_codon:yes gene_type:complete
MKKYTIENYYGGEQEDEMLYADDYKSAKSLQRGEFSLIVNNVTKKVSE